MTIYSDIFDNFKDPSSKLGSVLNFYQLKSFPSKMI